MKHILFAIGLYFVAYLYLFWQTPLGMEPVLDGSENFLLSEQIVNCSLPQEPFFRSMLYPLILAFFRLLGFKNYNMMFAIGLFGLVIHVLGSYLVGELAYLLWKNKKCSYAASIFYGFYPPMIFYAAEPFDAAFAYVMLLAAFVVFFKALEKQKVKYFSYSGLLMGLSVLARSNCLPAACVFLYESKITKKIPKSIVILALMLLLNAFSGYIISGEFRIMPWQGAYNLFTANNSNANGKYYQHIIDVSNRKQGTNPGRTEIEIIYKKLTNKSPMDDVNEFNRFWYKQTFISIKENFSFWIWLNVKKIYYLFNNFDQYNNKTFSYHKALSPILKYNPLCFGMIVVMFFLTISFFKLFQNNLNFKLCFVTLVALSCGIIAFYVSGRFRLMLVPILVPVSVGFINLMDQIKKNPYRAFLISILACSITFSAFFNANDTSTYKDDMMLTAFAASRLGMFEKQTQITKLVFKQDLENFTAARLYLSGTINLLLENINYKLNYDDLDMAIKILRKRSLYFQDTVLMDLYYSLFYDKDLFQAYRDFIKLPSEQYLLLPMLVLYWIANR